MTVCSPRAWERRYGISSPLRTPFGRRPPYGILRYADRTFQIPYTRELEEQLIKVLEAMQDDLAAWDVPHCHQDPRRCAACGYREVCDEAL